MTGNTIFIQIASYRDPQLVPTIDSLLENASDPEKLRFGIAWQHSKDDIWDNLGKYSDDSRFKVINIDYRSSEGVCWARSKIQELYNNEHYTLQIDSHHRFVKNWDTKLIEMLLDLQKSGYSKPIITTYVPSFDPDNDPEARVDKPWKMTFDRFIPEGAIFFLPAQFNSSKDDMSKPMIGRFYSGHFAFTLGSFVSEVPYDPNYYFHGEEINMAVRSFTHGYDIFYPHEVVCWHEYTRKKRIKQWDDDRLWTDKNKQSHARNRKLFGVDGETNNIDFGIYGFGSVRSLKDYEKFAGISFNNRSVTQDVLDHKPPKLENIEKVSDQEFIDSLIPIFKHCIDIHRDRVPEDDYDFWAIIFRNKDNKEIYRKDADSNEIRRLKMNNSTFINIWRSFRTKEKPCSWTVWPHSESKGWMPQINGQL